MSYPSCFVPCPTQTQTFNIILWNLILGILGAYSIFKIGPKLDKFSFSHAALDPQALAAYGWIESQDNFSIFEIFNKIKSISLIIRLEMGTPRWHNAIRHTILHIFICSNPGKVDFSFIFH